MQSLTAIVVVATFLTNLNSFKQDPIKYQQDIYKRINGNIASLIGPGSVEDSDSHDEIALARLYLQQVLGEKGSYDAKTPSTGDENVPTSTPPKPTDTPQPSPTAYPQPTEPPSPTPTTMVAYDNFDQVGAVERAANEYGVEMNLMKSIATCESGFNAYAHNTTYDYAGLFQFSVGTWISTRVRMGLNTDPQLRFSAEEAAKTAAFKIKHDGPGAWSGCL